ncbi:hypothetical protein, partial [Alkalibacterium sp. m-11]
ILKKYSNISQGFRVRQSEPSSLPSYHPTIETVGFLARKTDNLTHQKVLPQVKWIGPFNVIPKEVSHF